MSYERRHEPVLGRAAFVRRVARHAVGAGGLIVFGLVIGTVGYRVWTGLPWIDSFLNASMIRTEVGPVDRMGTDGAKPLTAVYALSSGLVFAASSAVVIAPIFHRVLHRFHAKDDATGP